MANGTKAFGLGFTVSGRVHGGGRIGLLGESVNEENKRGKWTLDQWTSSYATEYGKPVVIAGRVQNGGQMWRDIDSTGIHSAPSNSDKFSRYDHPSIVGNGDGVYKNQSFVVKVYNGKYYCEVAFHIVQRGNVIHWGSGAVGVWPR